MRIHEVDNLSCRSLENGSSNAEDEVTTITTKRCIHVFAIAVCAAQS